jgi:hypothetical protein
MKQEKRMADMTSSISPDGPTIVTDGGFNQEDKEMLAWF